MGLVNNYQQLDKPDTIAAWISTLFVECFTKSPDESLKPDEFQSLAKRVVYSLNVINPDAIRFSSVDQVDVCVVNNSVSFKEDGRLVFEGKINIKIDDRRGQLSINDIRLGLENVDRAVSVPFAMLDNAKMNLIRHDTRSAVLNCATSIEIVIRKKVSE